ncbi:MAG TPA: sulfatase-like hydrolase/transferase [Verrucomicrobiae bacterium]|nr:sulfatase-like hydrolase/transferase [Verrucomicrobiae bacterium]
MIERKIRVARQRSATLLAGGMAALAPCLATADASAPAHPNIIYILTDDLGWGDLGVLFQNSRAAANNRSKPWHLTPNLDRFAAEGVQLPAQYCPAPVCAPSRASLLLGVSQGHANVRDNQFDKALENNHTLATVLKQAGYATAIIGKWGLQGVGTGETNPATWPAYPTKRGFDYFFGYARHSDGHEHYPKEGPYQKSKQVWDGTNNITPELDKCYTADLWTARAKQWIVDHEHESAAQPFFLYLAYDTPHATTELPTQAYPEGGGLHGGVQWLGTPGHMINTASGKVDSWMYPEYHDATWDNDHNPATPEVPWPDVYKRYATDVRRLDDAVADIGRLLKDLKIDNDTLVIFTSDNGPSIESYLPNRPLKANFFESYGIFDGIKRDCLEGGVRVPTLARWPGHIPAGKTVTQPSIAYDWMRTFADVAGMPEPARADGVSLLPELTGQGIQQDRGYLYVEYFNDGKTPSYVDFTPSNRGRVRNQMQAIRIGDYVGLRYDIKSHADPFEIYKVTVDPKEATNLAPGMGALEQQMKTLSLQVRRPDSDAPRPYDDELVPASSVAAVVKGVQWKAFEGNYPWVPDLETLPSVASGTADAPDLQKRTRDNDIGMFFTGYLNIPQEGTYTFYLSADTGALLRIHDATVIDADYGYVSGKETSGSIRLQAGLHPFRLYYARREQGKPMLNFLWSGPGIDKRAVPADAFRRSPDQ